MHLCSQVQSVNKAFLNAIHMYTHVDKGNEVVSYKVHM